MDEKPDSSDKTEEPTAKRLEDGRRKGQVPRSVDLGAAAVSLAGAGAVLLFGTKIATDLSHMMTSGLTVTAIELRTDDLVVRDFAAELLRGFSAMLPLLLAVFAAAVAAPAMIGGWNFSNESLVPKGERLNPLSGIKRMFSLKSAMELAKSLAKFLFVGGFGVAVVWWQSDRVIHLARQPVGSAIASSAEVCALALLAMAFALALIAMIDAPFQLWTFRKEMRMTRDEVKREIKESDGSPEVKARIRSIQNALARGRMMQDVPTADVVVTNPTHYAVALRYEEGRDAAPVVVAKGADEIAAKIREIAAASNIPLLSAPPLARALFRHVEIGREIPRALYVAVAQVLTYLMQLKLAKRYGREVPQVPRFAPELEFAADPRPKPTAKVAG
jgi:flagellar biosynthetic protein FlhB